MLYGYGMRLRGFSIGCQPMDGFYERTDDVTGKYHDVIWYTRELTYNVDGVIIGTVQGTANQKMIRKENKK